MEQYHRASTVAEACEALAGDGEVTPIAGGQTLTLHLRQGLASPDRLVDVSRIEDMTRIVDDGDRVVVGGAVTYEALRTSPVVGEAFPFLAEAVGHVAGPQVRANGTVGGGLCHGDPALDVPPVLLTLDAEVTLRRRDGERTVPLTDFFTGFYETAREPDELLTEVALPKLPPGSTGTYRTMAPRQGDYAIAGVAVRATFDGENCATARVGLTNAGDTPLRAGAAEAALEGTALGDEAVEAAVAGVRDALDLVGDAQVPARYQETVFLRLARQAVRDVREARDGDDVAGRGS